MPGTNPIPRFARAHPPYRHKDRTEDEERIAQSRVSFALLMQWDVRLLGMGRRQIVRNGAIRDAPSNVDAVLLRMSRRVRSRSEIRRPAGLRDGSGMSPAGLTTRRLRSLVAQCRAARFSRDLTTGPLVVSQNSSAIRLKQAGRLVFARIADDATGVRGL